MAAPEGLEPPTLGSEDRCSIQLSYGAAILPAWAESRASLDGQPKAAVPTKYFFRRRKWGGKRDSNPQPPEPQSGALPVELFPPQELHYSNWPGRKDVRLREGEAQLWSSRASPVAPGIAQTWTAGGRRHMVFARCGRRLRTRIRGRGGGWSRADFSCRR